MEKWRVIYDGRYPAAFNMAADAFLLHTAGNGTGPPILRFYGWDKPSITIGYHQNRDRAVDWHRLGETPIVRRITGGRALFHDDHEVTYALAGNFIRFPVLGSDLHESYNLISHAIVEFYREHGWPALISHRDQPISPNGSAYIQKGCFASISRHEVMVSGQKVAAGSQRRTKTSFLQHGAIKIAAPRFHPAILDGAEAVAGEHFGVIGGEPAALAENITKIFSKIYNVEFSPEPFSPGEKADIDEFMETAIIERLH